MVFVFLDRTGRSFVKCFLRQCFLDSFASFVVKNEMSLWFSVGEQGAIFASFVILRRW